MTLPPAPAPTSVCARCKFCGRQAIDRYGNCHGCGEKNPAPPEELQRLRSALAAAREEVRLLKRTVDEKFTSGAGLCPRCGRVHRQPEHPTACVNTMQGEIEDQKARADKAEAEVVRLAKLHNECHDGIEAAQAETAKMRDKVAALLKIIENAPHGRTQLNAASRTCSINRDRPCDCWKAAALAATEAK